jgi:membrane-bound lytic murein transglycosylase A
MILRACAAAAVAVAVATPAMAEFTHSLLGWDALQGWSADRHAEALDVFLETCGDVDEPAWRAVCAVAAESRGRARAFFEDHFVPVLTSDGNPALLTGYYEPELDGSPVRTGHFAHAIYRLPPEVKPGAVWHSRAEIETRGLLEGRGLEIAWLSDPVEAFFLQVQGSGRIRLADGRRVRVGFGGRNGHPYRSIGAELVRQGIFERHEVSAQRIKRWVRENPEAGTALLRHNPSFIFFREVNEVPPDRGPLGAMNRSVTALRSVAVDPEIVPLGAPVWIEKGGREPMNRLMVAQDTGSAIKGPQRADIFFGTGDAAGERAGLVRDPGRVVVLLPHDVARRLAAGN